ncbi:MAG TPA: RHS repeat-associated core domain-containing protein, partial [Saprospiraceae bacterium]|nr:RHS repeat-associated core domain-containing protein [Saprospiraceae bacterium]
MNVEQSKFVRYANARRINATIFDHTNGSNPGYSERLSGGTNEIYGLARSISVMAGDVIQAEVYAKYVDPNSSNWTSALTTLMSQIASNTAGVVYDGSGYSTSTSSFPSGFIGLQTKSDDGAPKAYLNWLVFDRNYVFQPALSGYKQITTAGKEAGTDVPHEYVSSPTFTITQPGYVYIYLSNENTTPVEVYFDDFKVTQNNSPVIQQEDYYPFGATFNSYQRENVVPNKYLFNAGSELVDDLGLQIYLTDHRTYDPWGRLGWWQIDPKPDHGGQESLTPYHYAFNNPILHNDPKGDCPPGVNCAALIAAASADASVHPNGVGAHTLGIAQGLGNSAEGLVNAVSHPIQTLQGLGNLALAGLAGNPASAMQMDAALGTNSYGAMTGVTNAVMNGANNLVNGNGIQRGTVIGEIGGAIIGSKGLSAGLSGLRGALTTSATGRVFWSGGDIAKTAAADFAKATGGKTLEMTFTGKIMNSVSPILPRSITGPVWNGLSTNFAKGASGSANFFTTPAGPRAGSIWS